MVPASMPCNTEAFPTNTSWWASWAIEAASSNTLLLFRGRGLGWGCKLYWWLGPDGTSIFTFGLYRGMAGSWSSSSLSSSSFLSTRPSCVVPTSKICHLFTSFGFALDPNGLIQKLLGRSPLRTTMYNSDLFLPWILLRPSGWSRNKTRFPTGMSKILPLWDPFILCFNGLNVFHSPFICNQQ